MKNAATTQVLRSPEKYIGRSVSTECWRYTEWDKGIKGVELYDHTIDFKEYHNLAEDPNYFGVRNEMKDLILKD